MLDRVDTTFLQEEIDSIPDKITDMEGFELWQAFFGQVGSHIIIRASYGARLQLVSFQSYHMMFGTEPADPI